MKCARPLLLLLLAVVMCATARAEDDYDRPQFLRAADRMDEVTATGDTAAMHLLADSLFHAGEQSGNYRVLFLYYETMNLYHYLAGTPTMERLQVYEDAMAQARRMGKDGMYWTYYYLLVVNMLYENSSLSLERANAMLAEARECKSTLGLIRSYHALAFIYYFRSENMMAVEVAQKAVAYAEEHLQEDRDIVKLLYDEIYMNLSVYYSSVPDVANALRILDRVEHFLSTTREFTAEEKDVRMMDVLGRRIEIAFADEQYDRVQADLQRLRQYPTYDSYIMGATVQNLYYCILLTEGRDAEALQMAEEADEDVKHSFLSLYYKYHHDYKRAMEETEKHELQRDSATYHTRLEDMAMADASMKNAKLQGDKERLQARQRMTVLGSAAGILLLVVGFVTLLLIRNRRHARVLQGKNDQLQLANKEAIRARDEAEQQRAVAEERRQEADEQRAVAEERRQEADEQRRLAEKANEMKTHFIENMMHEIRTPLNAISGFSAVLTDPAAAEAPEALKAASDQISSNTQHLVHLLDDILMISNYESLSVSIEMDDVGICDMLLSCLMNSTPVREGVTLVPQIEQLAEDNPKLFSNAEMLQRAFGCMLHNAVKFTHQGTISVGADYDDEQVTFWVEDTGPGIPLGEEEHIFERFVKLDNFIPGTGLGLSLCRAIVASLNGRAYVDRSTPRDRGSRFCITVPRQLHLLGTAKPKASAAAPTTSSMVGDEELEIIYQEMRQTNPDITKEEILRMLVQ